MLIPEGLHSVERDGATHLACRSQRQRTDAYLRHVGFDLCSGLRYLGIIFSRGGSGVCEAFHHRTVNSATSMASVTLMGLMAGSTLQMML